MSNCSSLTNKTLYQLSKYTRTDDQALADSETVTDDDDGDGSGGPGPKLLWDYAVHHDTRRATNGAWKGGVSPDEHAEAGDDEDDSSEAAYSADDEDVYGGAGDGGSMDDAGDATGANDDVAGDRASADNDSAGVDSSPGATAHGTGSTAGSGSSDTDMMAFQHNLAIHRPVKAAMMSVLQADVARLQLDSQPARDDDSSAPGSSRAATVAGPSEPPGTADTNDVLPEDVLPGGLVSLKLCGNEAFHNDGVRALLNGPVSRGSLQHLNVSHCRSISEAGLQIPPVVSQQIVPVTCGVVYVVLCCGSACNQVSCAMCLQSEGCFDRILAIPMCVMPASCLGCVHNIEATPLHGMIQVRAPHDVLHVHRCHAYGKPCVTDTLPTVVCPQRLQGVLQSLKAAHCRAITQLAVQLPLTHSLQSIDLSCCHYLREVTMVVPNLKHLNLSSCSTLYRLRLRYRVQFRTYRFAATYTSLCTYRLGVAAHSDLRIVTNMPVAREAASAYNARCLNA